MIFRLLAETLIKRGEPGWTQEVDRAQTREQSDYVACRTRMRCVHTGIGDAPAFRCLRSNVGANLYFSDRVHRIAVRSVRLRVSVVLPTRCV